jgi:DNA-binding CsgD family transcriptional regulator
MQKVTFSPIVSSFMASLSAVAKEEQAMKSLQIFLSEEVYLWLRPVFLDDVGKFNGAVQDLMRDASDPLNRLSLETSLEKVVRDHADRRQQLDKLHRRLMEAAPWNRRRDSNKPILTEREKEIVRLLEKGMASKEIADALGNSVNTVNAHRSNMMRKLGCKNTLELVSYVLRNDLLGECSG